jgi:adenosylcobyric acid synthase
LCWAARPQDIDRADLVILPGSKHVAADLAWLAQTGLAEAVQTRAHNGDLILGICGGMQMLGTRIEDKAGGDGSGRGLGLLPLATAFHGPKQTQTTATQFLGLPAPWTVLSQKTLTGYQIRHGQTTTINPVAEALPAGLGYVRGPVLGIYLHGLFEQPEILQALFGEPPPRSLDQAFDELADALEEHLDVPALLHQIGVVRAGRPSLASSRRSRRRRCASAAWCWLTPVTGRGSPPQPSLHHARSGSRVARLRDPVHQVR